MPRAPLRAPDPAKVAAAKAKAAADLKAKVDADQAWLDTNTAKMTPAQKKEVYAELSDKCAGTTMKDGQIVLACPIPRRFTYCEPGDPFICANGTVKGKKGCQISGSVTDALKAKGSKVDAAFVSREEGGAYLSPYVPWGAITGSKKGLKLTSGNASGVTIGTGVDLGAVTDKDAYLADLRKRGVSEETLTTLDPLIGKKRGEACDALRTAKGDGQIVLPEADVEKIDQKAFEDRIPGMKKAYEATAKRTKAALGKQLAAATDPAKAAALKARIDAVPAFDDLSSREQSVLFSTYYHEGNLSGPASQDFLRALVGGDDAAARSALVDKSASAAKLIAQRGASELQYWDGHP